MKSLLCECTDCGFAVCVDITHIQPTGVALVHAHL